MSYYIMYNPIGKIVKIAVARVYFW